MNFNDCDPLLEEVAREMKVDWKNWDGGLCPVSGDTEVEVTYRDFSNHKAEAQCFRWNHSDCSDACMADSDIVAYRVISKVASHVELEDSPMQTQVGGSHYKDMAIQPVEFIHKNGIGYMEGNVIKYVSRWRGKNGLEDLKKARHYIDLLIEMESGKNGESNNG